MGRTASRRAPRDPGARRRAQAGARQGAEGHPARGRGGQAARLLERLGSVCGEVAKAASVVASIAAAVGTCGAATPLAAVAIGGAVLSTAGFLDGETHVLQKLGVDAGTADLVDMGMSLAGVAGSAGAGLLAGGDAASTTTEVVERTAAATTGVAEVGKGASEIEASQALGGGGPRHGRSARRSGAVRLAAARGAARDRPGHRGRPEVQADPEDHLRHAGHPDADDDHRHGAR